MARDVIGPPSTLHQEAERLNSWKEIAAFLGRSVATVQRWEKEEALPVQRHIHKKQSSIYAYKSELEEWWRERGARLATADDPGATTIASRWRDARMKITAVSLVVLAGVATMIFLVARQRAARAASERVMLAVLPFQNLGGGDNLEYVCDGFTEDLITELGSIEPERLGIIARTSTTVYKHSNKNIRQVGDELGVHYVVEGSLRFSSDRSRITAQLIRVSDQSHLWARTFESDVNQLFTLEQQIAREIAAEVNIRVNATRERSARRNSSDAEAYRLYMQGREHWNKRTQRDLERSIELYEEAVKRDPGYARAYAAMADSYNLLGYFGFRPLGIVIPKSQSAAQRALELDAQLAEGHAALGFINAMWIWDWAEAERRFQRAIQLDPAYVPAHHYYALFLASSGKLPQAVKEMALAQRLDPLSAVVNGGLAYVLFLDRQHARSLDYCDRALELNPDYAVAYAVRGWNLVELKRYDEGITALQRALELLPDSPVYLATTARALVLAGNQAEADRVLHQLEALAAKKWVGGSMRAIIYAAKGDSDAAFRWLDIAVQQEDGFMLWAKVTPEFDVLRHDRRFQELLRRLQLAG